MGCTWEGKKQETGLGSSSTGFLAAARAKAAAAREQLGQGINPRDAAKPQVQAVTRKSLTIEQAMHTFITSHHATWSNAKHSAQWESSLTRHASVPMRRDVSEITTADVEAVLAPIWLPKIETAGRVRQRIERILSAAIARGDGDGPNPAGWRDNLEHILPAQKKVRVV